MRRSGVQASGQRESLLQPIREDLNALRLDQASSRLAALPSRMSNDPEVLYLRAGLEERSMRFSRAIELGERSLRDRRHVLTLELLVRCHKAKGETDAALGRCDELEGLIPRSDRLLALRAAVLESAGRFAEAREALEVAVRRAEGAGTELSVSVQAEWAKVLVQEKSYEEAVSHIDNTLARGDVPAPLRASHLYLRAKALDRAGRYEDAADSAAQANLHDKVPFDAELYERQVDALIDNWSREAMDAFPISACDSAVPVFVAGMPRSGTSLIDQIIDAHPKAAGVGELNSIEQFAIKLSMAYNPDKPPSRRFGSYDAYRWTRAANEYLKQITQAAAPGAERIVNKALGNNKLVGLLARLFPNTRVIHAIRDPRDVAVSCFMGGFNNKLHAWTTQIDWVVRAWEQSMRMMEHWKASLDTPILDVHYERLVADPEREMPRIIEFLGLEWDDACRDFYKSRRTVRTLSYDQVNRPLYTSSSGRHKNYTSLLEGVEFPAYDPFA